MSLSTDHLIIGAGVSGLAFADTLVRHSDVEITIVDRRTAPGGHWVDVYPFVRLHSPSTYYGVDSLRLGQDRIDTEGPNAGLYERATATEIQGYFGEVADRLVATGRVRLLLGHEVLSEEVDADGARAQVRAPDGHTATISVRRRIVDARFLETSVPATHTPSFQLAADAAFVPVHRLPEVAADAGSFTILGAGKTGVDAVLWLLENGVDSERIRWVRPRDAYFHDREAFQALDLVVDALEGFAKDAEIGAQAADTAELVAGLEDAGRMIRLDPDVPASMYRGAMLSRSELERARQVRDVVRLGRVRRLERDRMVLDQGEVATGGALHVDASATGLRDVTPRPIFAPGRIVLQQVRHKTPPFNAALLGWVEANRDDDETKNRLCPPNPYTREVGEWARTVARTWRTEGSWRGERDLQAWVGSTRLNMTAALPLHLGEERAQAALGRFGGNVAAAVENLERIAAAR